MRRALRLTAVLITLGSLTLWVALGQNPGWTKTRVAVMRHDPVTSLEFPVYQKQFLPGLDFLALSLSAAAALGIVSVFLPSRKHKP